MLTQLLFGVVTDFSRYCVWKLWMYSSNYWGWLFVLLVWPPTTGIV